MACNNNLNYFSISFHYLMTFNRGVKIKKPVVLFIVCYLY